MDVTKPYKFIRFGAMDVTKPYRFIGFGAMGVTNPTTTTAPLIDVEKKECSMTAPSKAVMRIGLRRPVDGVPPP